MNESQMIFYNHVLYRSARDMTDLTMFSFWLFKHHFSPMPGSKAEMTESPRFMMLSQWFITYNPYVYIYICIHMYIYTHTHTHTHIHIHIHTYAVL